MENCINQTSAFQVAEINISYSSKIRNSERPKLNSSREVYKVFSETWNTDTIELYEQFKVLLLNRANRVIGLFEVSSGGVSGTIADPKLIFGTALKAFASAIILAHNHPSGALRPSRADIGLTEKIKEGGKLLDIEVLDHLIITTEGFYSFADEGMMF